jgi:hypothetical protein
MVVSIYHQWKSDRFFKVDHPWIVEKGKRSISAIGQKNAADSETDREIKDRLFGWILIVRLDTRPWFKCIHF